MEYCLSREMIGESPGNWPLCSVLFIRVFAIAVLIINLLMQGLRQHRLALNAQSLCLFLPRARYTPPSPLALDVSLSSLRINSYKRDEQIMEHAVKSILDKPLQFIVALVCGGQMGLQNCLGSAYNHFFPHKISESTSHYFNFHCFDCW